METYDSSKVYEKIEQEDGYTYKVKNLPAFSNLKVIVDGVVKESTWFERHGYDWLIILTALGMIVGGLAMAVSPDFISAMVGWMIYGIGHTVCFAKASHLAAHGTLTDNQVYTNTLMWFFGEIVSSFSYVVGYEGHIQMHHPHTNVIGLGDSSVWKIPQLPRFLYMFAAPLFLPIITPFVSVGMIWGRWKEVIKYIFWLSVGTSCVIIPLTVYGGYSVLTALLAMFAARAILCIPYIHINIFQHIGLSMYMPENRPSSRLFQMTTAVLNLNRHPLLDYVFGHSLISCHVEHHLFPRLSDYMCLKVKPLVEAFITQHGLPYQQDTYMNRLGHFVSHYDKLMVHAPPITHFVGLQ